MKKILVTNDDGIRAQGIWKLVNYLSGIADVYVAAPAEEQSAKSQSVTFLTDVTVRETAMLGATAAYEMDGTPVDCVIWAVDKFREEGIEFDYLFSGINHGANVGLASYYSGTISAAREGALQGIRSIALSVGKSDKSEFDYILDLVPQLLKMSDSLSPSTVLSVNAPDLPRWAVKGVKIVEAAPWGYGESYRFSEVSEGRWQLAQHHNGNAGKDLRYDYDCFHNGYASISPLISYASDKVAFSKLRGLFPQEKTLVVIMDVQDGIASVVAGRERFEDNIFRMAKCTGRLDLPSVITELYGYGPTMKGVAAAANTSGRSETVLRREFGAWGSAGFARLMESVAADRVIIAGLETHTAVLQTARGFAERGYDVTVIEDCCASRIGHDHKMAVSELRDAGIHVTTLRAAMIQLLHATNHPAAETVMRILNE